MDGSGQVLATEELGVWIGYGRTQSPGRVRKNSESGSGTERSATEEKSCPSTTEPSEAVETF